MYITVKDMNSLFGFALMAYALFRKKGEPIGNREIKSKDK